jgi:hypothetical protein
MASHFITLSSPPVAAPASSVSVLPAPPRSSSFDRWLCPLLWLSYIAAIVLLVVVLVPGSWDSNSESWKPVLGLEVFSVRVVLLVI